MAPRNTLIPSLLPQRAFSDNEDALFDGLDADAEIDALLDALFPDAQT